ncbi:unnamed protein product [Nezara viridula]|uniref:Uncharacterized protein n=1 Tax=Nezara viridula TaxID=85310 RepID=A0A9P0MDD9_NEZVI|nr:unnamed protein product [Nezara viridula]
MLGYPSSALNLQTQTRGVSKLPSMKRSLGLGTSTRPRPISGNTELHAKKLMILKKRVNSSN